MDCYERYSFTKMFIWLAIVFSFLGYFTVYIDYCGLFMSYHRYNMNVYTSNYDLFISLHEYN